uniref:Uncharacterized protein n=1 Tax=Biomphalaria glabrata TaxID=6526 RepID=A0A2C9L2N9_BIOGL
MHILFFLLLSLYRLLNFTSILWNCKPFEENKPYTLSTRWHTKISAKVAWVKNDAIYATCDINMSCESYFEHVAQIRTALNQDGFFWVNLTILNATRREADVWTLKFIEGIETQASIIEQCDLKSYVKAERVDCETIQATDGMSVQCVVTRVWPQAVCLFNTSLHNTSIEYSISNVTHQHELSSQAPAYYKTTCSAKVLYTGTFDIDITVFPNITGADDNLEFRTSLHYNYT